MWCLCDVESVAFEEDEKFDWGELIEGKGQSVGYWGCWKIWAIWGIYLFWSDGCGLGFNMSLAWIRVENLGF